ncbi:conserved hypothetical protein [Vibrio chagasii]|nr:conserved hypothetical protein [Vibrio chagasii]CAH7352889.1 conserved hypothetical protein [Vibrio chagasii]CAH7385075.1 conserved hypothetical protein [Vibrio chagasii]
MLERSNIEFPLWRKKVDGTLLKDANTPIPTWLWRVWEVEETFGAVKSKKDLKGTVSIKYLSQTYQGQVAKIKSSSGHKFRLYIDNCLSSELRDTYLMSYMRVLETELDDTKTHRQVESDIPFWEFIDIEFDASTKTFIFTPHYTVTPQFPNLFSRLIQSAPLKSISAEKLEKNSMAIHKQDWKPREEYKMELGAENVIYMLLDSKSKLIYVGEAKHLKQRFDNGHPDIRNWDYYKYNVLPTNLAPYRLSIERMAIRDMASILGNKQGIENIVISDFQLANRKIDK